MTFWTRWTVEVNFCFLSGPLKWLTAAKNATILIEVAEKPKIQRRLWHRSSSHRRFLLSEVQGRIQDFFRRGCTRLFLSLWTESLFTGYLFLYFNTNKPHSFFWQNTSCIRKPQVISGGGGVRTSCTLPLDPPLKWHIIRNSVKFCQILRCRFWDIVKQLRKRLAWILRINCGILFKTKLVCSESSGNW